jgi:hypothetical protein
VTGSGPIRSVTLDRGQAAKTLTVSPFTDTLTEPNEEVSVHLLQAPGITDIQTSSLSLIIMDGIDFGSASNFVTWLVTNNLNGVVDTLAVDDPDGDGVVTFLEYVHGTNPNATTPKADTSIQLDILPDGDVEIRIITAVDIPEIQLTIESSVDLGSWQPDQRPITLSTETVDTERVRRIYRIDTSGDDAPLYYRFVVSLT